MKQIDLLKLNKAEKILRRLLRDREIKVFKFIAENDGVTQKQMVEELENVTQPDVSIATSLLYDVGLITFKKDGKKMLYYASLNGIERVNKIIRKIL